MKVYVFLTLLLAILCLPTISSAGAARRKKRRNKKKKHTSQRLLRKLAALAPKPVIDELALRLDHPPAFLSRDTGDRSSPADRTAVTEGDTGAADVQEVLDTAEQGLRKLRTEVHRLGSELVKERAPGDEASVDNTKREAEVQRLTSAAKLDKEATEALEDLPSSSNERPCED